MKFSKLLVLTILLSCFFGQAQAQNDYEHYTKIWKNGLRYNDLAVSKMAMYHMMTLKPEDKSLLDSLAYLYFEFQNYPSCILVCRDILSNNPSHMPALEMSAVAFEQVGVVDKALETYESIYLKTNDPLTLYKMAFIQFDLKRFKESNTSIDIILKDEKAAELKIVFPTADQQSTIDVPIQAALYNLKGLIHQEEKKMDQAKAFFEESIKLSPEFYLPKENLKSIQQK